MTPAEKFALTPGDRASPVWQKLKKYFEHQRELCRSHNDGDLDERKTAGMRARIAVYKSLIALDDDRDDVKQ